MRIHLTIKGLMDLMVATVVTVADLIFEGCFCSQAPRRTSELFNAFSFHANGDPIYDLVVPVVKDGKLEVFQ